MEHVRHRNHQDCLIMLRFEGGINFVVLALIALWAIRARRNSLAWPRIWLVATFAYYLGELAHVTLFPIPVDGSMAAAYERDGVPFLSGLALDPLAFAHYDARQVLGNLVLAVPFGLLLPSLRPMGTRAAISACVAFPVAIETMQAGVALVVGFMYRSVDLADVVLNSAGALAALPVGIFLRRALERQGIRLKPDPSSELQPN